ncbi:hypothetical protein [Comamonas terrigena]|uniref:hypothetical protein n=1 Tax=Comamonas terrigena TaxID=32013 RepID=UPI002448E89B|nr:hypothetical protein [Comamonas terrigena]MDH1702901.1 hypothetical protein [Comamonas terrigena]
MSSYFFMEIWVGSKSPSYPRATAVCSEEGGLLTLRGNGWQRVAKLAAHHKQCPSRGLPPRQRRCGWVFEIAQGAASFSLRLRYI